MAQFSRMLFAIIAASALFFAEGKQGGFHGGEQPATEGTVAAKEIKANLKESLEAALGFGSNEERMRVVEAAIFRTFQALPKNRLGRLAPKAVRHLIQRFFSKVHGWTIDGLNGVATASSDSTEASGFSQSQVPALMEAAIEARQHGRGLSMSEVVALAVALERLILEDAEPLQDASALHGVPTTQALDKEEFGRWQDEQCSLMRSALEKLDVNGTGRVPLEDFRAMDGVGSFTFSEDEDALRRTGSLDTSVPGKPSLRIANYVVAPGNCGKYAGYYSVCCQNSCNPILEALEGRLQSSSADPERLIELIGNISSNGDELAGPTSPLLGRNGEYLRARLNAIAEGSSGKVNLDSRLFAQWMHFAFPRECPHPVEVPVAPQQPLPDKQLMELVKAVAPEQWDMQDGFVPQWDEEDSLPLIEEIPTQNAEKVASEKPAASYFAMIAQFAALMALFVMALRTGLDGMRASAAACGLTTEKSKERAAPTTIKVD